MPTAPGIQGGYCTDLPTRARYSEGAGIYRIVPQAVALPINENDVIALLRWAREQKVPLTPRGAGSSVTGSNVGDGIIVDLTRMPRRLEVFPDSQTARVSANIRWGELTEAAASHGLRLPPDPSSGSFATLGGMVSTNASGARSVRYGSVRPWVLGLTVITSDGTHSALRRGMGSSLPLPRAALLDHQDLIRSRYPGTTKNSAGYALEAWLRTRDDLDLLIGAEGTLGIITEIEWKMAPIPAHRAGLRVQLADLGLLTRAVEAVLPLSPSAVELLDRTFLELVAWGGVDRPSTPPEVPVPESILLIEFESEDAAKAQGAVNETVRRLGGMGEIEVALTPEEEARVWRLRHAASPIIADLPPGRRSLQVIEDACVPVPRMGEYIASVRSLAHRLGVPVVIFGHAGDGNIHVNLLPQTDLEGWEGAVEVLHREITGEVIRLGGTTSGEHGDGRIRGSVLEQLYGTEILALFHLVKDSLDPHGILNPGVKLPGKTGPVDRQMAALRDLKVGAGAASIPAEIAEELREIERTGDYLRDRLS